jgi:NAD-dependent deacetylase
LDKKFRDFIKKSFKEGSVVCITGAGISHESSIPTFRGKGGLWEKYDPEVYAYMQGLVSKFRQSPEELVDFISDFYDVLLKAEPNPAHISLAALEKAGIVKAVITQNIDNLHQRAGSRSVVELHGNSFRIRCSGCGSKLSLENGRIREMIRLFEKNSASRIRLLRVLSRYCPRCKGCGGRYRIDIVLFGEQLPDEELKLACELLSGCKVLLVVGSSLVVYPAASLPLLAKEKGAKLIEINSEPCALSDIFDYNIIGKAGEILPEIARLLI